MAAPQTNPRYDYLDRTVASDGTILGQTITSKIGFWAVTATTQPTATQQAVAISTAAVSISATQWAFGTSTQADGVVRLVNQLRGDLVSLGLIKGS